jgi:hypothetical protein
MSLLSDLIGSILETPGRFADVAAHDPLSAVLIAFGALFVFLSVGVFGYLTAGAAVDFLTGGDDAEPRQPIR